MMSEQTVSNATSQSKKVIIRENLENKYSDIYTKKAFAALEELARFNEERALLMLKRMKKRAARSEKKEHIQFLNPHECIPRTHMRVQDVRDGKFEGAPIPKDLERQWIQGTGPATKPRVQLENSIRNVAYALLSGADGWMFDGEDALGQIETMSLDNQRNLKLAIHHDPLFLKVAETISREMNEWAMEFFGKKIITDWKKQLGFTTTIFRLRGLHLDDRHIRDTKGHAFSASITDLVLYVVNNYEALQKRGSSIVLYLPKIQTAEEAAFFNEIISALEEHLGLALGTIKVYVLVEQLEATFQLIEIRAALTKHFVGFNTGRWDYINSVADALSWDNSFSNPNIEEITMTYGYMKTYEDRVRRAVNTRDMHGNYALWQGGMEPNIPVGSEEGISTSMKKAIVGAERELEAGASGKWIAHWKMVHIVRPVWEKVGKDNQLGRKFPALTYTDKDRESLVKLEPAPRTIRGARNLVSVALQYGNAFLRGYQAAALKPADFFNTSDILYLMEDMATGEIRLSILWEWLHKKAKLTDADPETKTKKGDVFTFSLFERLVREEYEKLTMARDTDVHNDSKATTLPIAREIVLRYVTEQIKFPWYIDLLNINLNNNDFGEAQKRIAHFMDTFKKNGIRITENIDFTATPLEDSPQILVNDSLTEEVQNTDLWFGDPRFHGITRLYSARQVVEQRGTIQHDYTVARTASEGFYKRLQELFLKQEAITTFGPYSPGQAVTMKRSGIEGIYLGGWATSAKGSVTEDPGPDLASYPLSQVPDEAATIVRALLTADKNQIYSRSKMNEKERKNTPFVDYTPYIIADADTGHGGETHVRNLIRRFVEIGVPGYHIEDQKPGVKKCGHQAGKVLVGQDEQVRRLNAARFQLDIMKVPGIIVARTDAEAATLIDTIGDERDHPYILGVTNSSIPSHKLAYLTILKTLYEKGMREINGHLLYRISDNAYKHAHDWLTKMKLIALIDTVMNEMQQNHVDSTEAIFDTIMSQFIDTWQTEAKLKPFGEAVAAVMEYQIREGITFELSVAGWKDFIQRVSLSEARDRAKSLGIDIDWDAELAKTPEGYYQVQGGIDYAITKSLAAAPFADLLWMETKTAHLEDAKKFATAIHRVYPNKLLAYNLSPSFNWDTTGMSDEEIKNFPKELGKLGYVFNFITYGGHQIDGLAAEEFATALQEDGMLALARLQRKLRLINSSYKTPQSHVGGPRLDGALMACSGRTATTKAMGKGSTHSQHLVQTEVSPKVLDEWLALWAQENNYTINFHAHLRPHTAGSDLLELSVVNETSTKIANIIFATIQDRHKKSILSIRDQNTFEAMFRQKRLMTLLHLFLIHRYKASSVHYVTPTDDNQKQTKKMKELRIFQEVNLEIGDIIVASVNTVRSTELMNPDKKQLINLIAKKDSDITMHKPKRASTERESHRSSTK